jgi:trimeric autotransporter adhesin
LIIGYDEDPAAIGLGLIPGARGGSHNLVIGRWHSFGFGAFGGLVAGEANAILSEAATVSGGQFNMADGIAGNVSGGLNNSAGLVGSVSGGLNNSAGFGGSVLGGQGNDAGEEATVCGGVGNTAAGVHAVVIGGSNITDNNDNSIAPGAPLNYP